MMAKIELQGLVREFDDGTHVGPIDLVIEDGELLTLLGPSGSGKTTTLRMVAGFIEDVEGKLLFDGKDMVNIPPRERSIGMVFQSVALFPNMSVYQNISFGPEMAGWKRERTIERVEELADLLGIRRLLLRKVSEISGGEAQRVKLAKELGKVRKDKSLYILDEPTVGLSFYDAAKLIDLLEKLVQEGNSVLIIEHDPEILSYCDYIIELGPEGGPKGGEVIAEGSPEEIVLNKKSKTGPYLN